jgi:hypothetical protein
MVISDQGFLIMEITLKSHSLENEVIDTSPKEQSYVRDQVTRSVQHYDERNKVHSPFDCEILLRSHLMEATLVALLRCSRKRVAIWKLSAGGSIGVDTGYRDQDFVHLVTDRYSEPTR